MIRRSIQDYFFFGTALRFLQDAEADWRIANSADGVMFVRDNLEQLLAYLVELSLKVSALTDAAKTLGTLLEEFQDLDDDATLSDDDAVRLTTAIKELRLTLEAELRATYAYSITPKRMDVARLIDAPASLLAPGAFGKLPEIAQFDICEAARCIAFEVPTAAVFYLMRATESVLRAFYRRLVIRGARAKMWGEIISDLRKRRVGARHVPLLNHLDHIRSAFRNPTQHPEARYSIEEAQDLWSLAVDVINRMASHLPKPAA